MNNEQLKALWKQEEDCAHIHGWDFSHIHDRYQEEQDLPWDYESIIKSYLNDGMKLLDYDTGGAEFLLSLRHPNQNTFATEGYPDNVKLCQTLLCPLGIGFKECIDPTDIPFEDSLFDIIINRHGDFDATEFHRLLKQGGLFITEQVGGDNDYDLVQKVLPEVKKSNPHLNLKDQTEAFKKAGFEILYADEAYRPILFYDVGAFVWFAHIIEWEFPGFSVDQCFNQLLEMQKTIKTDGKIEGTIHRYLIVARKI